MISKLLLQIMRLHSMPKVLILIWRLPTNRTIASSTSFGHILDIFPVFVLTSTLALSALSFDFFTSQRKSLKKFKKKIGKIVQIKINGCHTNNYFWFILDVWIGFLVASVSCVWLHHHTLAQLTLTSLLIWLIGKFGRDRTWVVGCNKGYPDTCIL